MRIPEFRGWLEEGTGVDQAYCKVCRKELVCGKSELLRHSRSKKHKANLITGGVKKTFFQDFTPKDDKYTVNNQNEVFIRKN